MKTPFDPTDPFDAMAQEFKTKVAMMAIEANKAAIYRDLGPHKQLECFVSGVLVGLIGVAFASVEPVGRDAMMEYFAKCLPIARKLAETMIDEVSP
jgi:hypothetical protein